MKDKTLGKSFLQTWVKCSMLARMAVAEKYPSMKKESIPESNHIISKAIDKAEKLKQ